MRNYINETQRSKTISHISQCNPCRKKFGCSSFLENNNRNSVERKYSGWNSVTAKRPFNLLCYN
jgi:hypothetical protein